jgi:iron complex outermembrane receptor protein
MSPNHVLVLVDGKRRHTTANLAVLGGPFQGGAGVDLNFIPVAAIERVEVLTDGAAAQYGSDAIAGVLNIITRKKTEGGSLEALTGGYLQGDGKTNGGGGSFAFPIGENGYFDLTAEIRNHAHSDRGDIDPRIVNATTAPDTNLRLIEGYPYLNRIQGDAEYHLKLAMFSAGYRFSDAVEVYSVGTWGKKDANSYENLRMPSRVAATITDSGGDTLTQYMYPYGMQPREATEEEDYSLTLGLRGAVAGWDWDLASSYGKDKVPMYTLDSGNRTLYANTGLSPSKFYDGTLSASQSATTLDFNRDFDVGLAGPMNVAFGAETRHEIYRITQGEPASYLFGGGQSFPGFSPTDAGGHGRTNYAGYLDVVLVPVDDLRLDAAVRYEHFDDFGNKTIGKLTGRYDFTPAFALRGTVSNGLNAPTLAEEFYSATNVGPGTAFAQLAPNSPAASLLGIGSGLKPEKSTNYSLGMVLRPLPELSITLDAFQIEVKDRIVGSGTLYGTIGGTV